jgi:hypothetical protein
MRYYVDNWGSHVGDGKKVVLSPLIVTWCVLVGGYQ